MIHKVGLLPRCNLEQLPFAYAMYRRDDKEGRRLSGIFKATFSTDVKINFVGVWYVVHRPIDSHLMSPRRDTVSSVGLIESSLPFAGKNPSILCFRHALSLDERRVKFRPFFYTGETYKSGGGTKESPGHVGESSGDTMVDEKPQDSSSGKMREDSTYDCETDFEEVFFAGVHCGVFWSIHAPRLAIHSHPFRHRRRICPKHRAQQPRADSASVDDQRMLQH